MVFEYFLVKFIVVLHLRFLYFIRQYLDSFEVVKDFGYQILRLVSYLAELDLLVYLDLHLDRCLLDRRPAHIFACKYYTSYKVSYIYDCIH
jgi:hypothetical protein